MESRPGTLFADQPQPELIFSDQCLSEGYVQPTTAFSNNNDSPFEMNFPLTASPPHQPLSGVTPVEQQSQKGRTPYSNTGMLMAPTGAGSLSRVACTECRSRHLKCDAKNPKCSRCRDAGSICIYKKSRRGWKGPGKKDRSGYQGDMPLSKDLPTSTSRNVDSATHEISNDLVAPLSPHLLTPPFLDAVQACPGPLASSPLPAIQHEKPTFIASDLSNLYYEHFHPAHPIVLPRGLLSEASKEKDLTQLHAVIWYIGSIYSPAHSTLSLLEAAGQVLISQTPLKDGFTVQALLLFAIALHSQAEQDRALQVLDDAIDIAVDIGMDRQEFASSNGEGLQCVEESWRRTWWELYVVDGMFAAIHQRETFRMLHVQSNVALPCEELDYVINKNNYTPHSLLGFQSRAFAGDEVVYSSSAYRIDAIRILGEVLAATDEGPSDARKRVDAADASLTSWTFDLPKSKAHLVGEGGKVDEMLFQAHMIIYAPRSNLAFASVQGETTCTRAVRYCVSPSAVDFHTTKAIDAANAISGLIKLPTLLLNHSPLFTCVITFAAIVHLSAYSLNSSNPEGVLTKGRIELSISALKQMREVWAIAGLVLQQVKEISREIFACLKPRELVSDGTQSWTTTEEEISRLLEDDTVWRNDLDTYMAPPPEQGQFSSLLDSG
ncbi:MAG: hypothetical protein M1830_001998 [Pleopsidium flavum]|nr:MAG: hypothetical protein M1830_001998 [Pleopsidium flavum]